MQRLVLFRGLSNRPSRYVIEVPAYTFEKLNIKVGDYKNKLIIFPRFVIAIIKIW